MHAPAKVPDDFLKPQYLSIVSRVVIPSLSENITLANQGREMNLSSAILLFCCLLNFHFVCMTVSWPIIPEIYSP